jgi:hypothetical protein
MHTLTATPPPRTVLAAGPCVAGDIGPERREIECEPVADPVPVAPVPAPAPVPTAPAPA